MRVTSKENQIISVFEDIYHLNVCGKDQYKVRRDVLKTNLNAKVMVIAEAMAPEQVRLSGVNYFYKDGKIGNTGKSLEKFLNFFNCSVYPDNSNCVYHTEIVHSFPGYIVRNNKKAIRRPTKDEIRISIESGILQKEIKIIKPELILLMGSTAYTTFYKYLLKKEAICKLSEKIKYITLSNSFEKFQNIPVIPIQHSSGANPRFNQMLDNKKLVSLIKSILYV